MMQASDEPPARTDRGEHLEPSTVGAISAFLRDQCIAALGTLHRGQPFVSMVPFALLSNGEALVIPVSRLAAHTQDMLRELRISLMVHAPPAPHRSCHLD